MHYNGPIIRPPTEADALFIEVTVGCTHDKCTFCNFYQDYPFRVAPLSQIEEDLKEAAAFDPNVWKVWASGGNPFALSTERLAEIARLIRSYLPRARIATYARINDIYGKSVEDLRLLKSLGINDIVIGIESGDDTVLLHVNKGYTSEDILRECKKLEEAGMDYRIIYLGGLAGYGRARESAKISAGIINQIHPNYMILTTVTILPGTPLYDEIKNGTFIPQTELERIEEFQELCALLTNEITIFAATSTTMVPFHAHFPDRKQEIVDRLSAVIESFDAQKEAALSERRAHQLYV